MSTLVGGITNPHQAVNFFAGTPGRVVSDDLILEFLAGHPNPLALREVCSSAEVLTRQNEDAFFAPVYQRILAAAQDVFPGNFESLIGVRPEDSTAMKTKKAFEGLNRMRLALELPPLQGVSYAPDLAQLFADKFEEVVMEQVFKVKSFVNPRFQAIVDRQRQEYLNAPDLTTRRRLADENKRGNLTLVSAQLQNLMRQSPIRLEPSRPPVYVINF